MGKLTEDAITAALTERPGWRRSDDGASISREVKFDGFPTAFAFMTAVAIEAQALDHHPDWSNAWATVSITLSTHSEGGLTDADFELAAKIDAHAERFGAR